jgi:CHAD domain-containing protein
VRDLDVQVDRVGQWSTEVPPHDRGALGDLARLLGQHRDEARRHLLASLESSRYERLVTSFSAMLQQGPSRRVAAARAPAAVVVPDLLRARHRAVTKAAKRARRSRLPDDFHRLRIRCKRLRYALEFVSELYRGQTTKYVRALVRLQDALGQMQDARVAAERLHDLVVDEGPALSTLTVFVMGGVAERYRHEAAELAEHVPKSMAPLTGGLWKQLVDHVDRRRLEAAPTYGWPSVGAVGPPRQVSPAPASTGRDGAAHASNGHVPEAAPGGPAPAPPTSDPPAP